MNHCFLLRRDWNKPPGRGILNQFFVDNRSSTHSFVLFFSSLYAQSHHRLYQGWIYPLEFFIGRNVWPRLGKHLLDARAQHLFRVLVQNYIKDGQPLGSRTLTQLADLDISPATVRNIMSDLEAMGYLQSPHTSAGRIPTAQGYRLFVDPLSKLSILSMTK